MHVDVNAPPTVTAAGNGNGRAANRAAELLDALEEMMLAEGFSRITVGDMAARLRCSRRTLYELAPGKQELVLLVLDRFFEQLRQQGRDAIVGIGDPGRQIFEYLQVGARAAQRLSPIVISDIDKWAPSRKLWQTHIRLRVDGLRNLVQAGIDAGRFRGVHAHLVAEIMFASMARLREPDFYANTNMSMPEAFGELAKLLLHGLLHKSG
ncbi:MAG: TetR/AcrR family transcriptional regulator [Gammaproteobacteria bacterium]|nr:TetR/AcrR family transcriptional regulator [Gammaproteobacteria bacterium]